MLRNLQLLADEDPELKISFDDEVKEIHLQLMGEIQIEILKNIIKKRLIPKLTKSLIQAYFKLSNLFI